MASPAASAPAARKRKEKEKKKKHLGGWPFAAASALPRVGLGTGEYGRGAIKVLLRCH